MPVMAHTYPWYDSIWLGQFARTKALLERERPDVAAEFIQAMARLRTEPSFEVRKLANVFDEEIMAALRDLIDQTGPTKLEMHELQSMGRFIVHDNPYVGELQQSLIDRVSELAGERVEASYNFLSMYTDLGVCPVHLDSPESKWTLDLCVRQSEPWPIHLSQIVPWPDPEDYSDEGWESEIFATEGLEFRSYTLEPGSAILFSGSSQWHHREQHPGGGGQFCDLVFFHFVPEGTRELIKPKTWPERFGVPEIASVL